MFKLGQLELLSRVPRELLGSDQRVWMTDELVKVLHNGRLLVNK
jgi:hypothetical protein